VVIIAKKGESKDSKKKHSFWNTIGEFIVKEVSHGVFYSLKETALETLESVEKKVNQIVHNALKRLVLFFLIITGFIFVLVGFSKYLSETVPALGNGLGYLLVGVVLVLLAMFANWMMK